MSPDISSESVSNQLEISLKEIGIPPRPAILDRISEETGREEPDFRRLANMIEADVALSASLIRIANSPFFGFRSRVQSPREALMLLGLDVTSQAVAGIIMRKVFPVSPHVERFWSASACVARLSGWLAQRVTKGHLQPSLAYTFGLFRDCGIPILLTRFPDRYYRILFEANHEAERKFTTVEDAALSINHAFVGSMLTQSWWLPDEINYSIRRHHDVEELDSPSIPPSITSRYLIAVAQFAEYLIQQHTGLNHTSEWQKFEPACTRLLGLDRIDAQDILEETAPMIDNEDW